MTNNSAQLPPQPDQPDQPDQAETADSTPTVEELFGSTITNRKVEKESRRAKRKAKRAKRWIIFLSILAVLGIAAASVAYVYQDKIPAAWDKLLEIFGVEKIVDYSGDGTGEILFSVSKGDNGSVIAHNLAAADVIMTSDVFYKLLLETTPEPVFYPGVYRLANQMSAKAALSALTNAENRVENTALIREGISYHKAIVLLSEATGVALADFEAAVSNPQKYGVPDEAPNIEGYLFPATYTFDPETSAEDIIRIMVNKTFAVLDKHGVAEHDRHRVLTMASIIQREAGSFQEDFYKVSRVFKNRLDQGWLLQSDATVSYGTGKTDTVWTTAADRADGNNLYNTYYHKDLPIGPISLPGELAIDAALNPVAGDWMFFMAVDLRTGETAFARTAAEHEANVQKLAAWCRVSENAGYCGR